MNISIGLTVSEGDSASHLEELIQQADRAVLRAKKDGRRPALITPHLDELAAEGVVFPRAYLAGIRCKNSRRAMMHGRSAPRAVSVRGQRPGAEGMSSWCLECVKPRPRL